MKGPTLLVEPSPLVADMVGRTYRAAGYSTSLWVAATAQEAIRHLSRTPGLAIVDVGVLSRSLFQALGRDIPLVVWAARSRTPLPGPACLYKPTENEECRLILKMIREYWLGASPAVIHDSRKALAFLCSGRSRSPSSTWRSCNSPKRTS